jgi:hypothetical protein
MPSAPSSTRLSGNISREAVEQSREANLAGKSQTIVIAAALGYLVHIRLGQRCFTDQFPS